MADNDIQTLPVSGYAIQAVAAYNALVLTPRVSPHASARPDESVSTNNYLLYADQARELANAILSALDQLESADKTPPEGHSH